MTSAFLPCFQPHRMPSLLGPLATQRRQSARFLASNRRVEPPNDGSPPALSSSPYPSGHVNTHAARVSALRHPLSPPSNAITVRPFGHTTTAVRPLPGFELSRGTPKRRLTASSLLLSTSFRHVDTTLYVAKTHSLYFATVRSMSRR